MTIPKGLIWYFRAISILGIGVVIGDLILSAKFGASISFEVMIIAAMISLASGLLLVLAAYYNFTGWKALSYALIAVWVPAFLFNIVSNMGVATANRMHEVQAARVQKSNFDEVLKGRAETENKLKFYLHQQKALNDQFAAMTQTQVGDWKVTAVPASTNALSTLVDEKRAARDREAGRGGCGPVCEKRQRELDHLVALHGVAAKLEKISGQIAATERGLKEARVQLASTDAGLSNTANQSTLYAKWFRWTSNPDMQTVETANEGMGIAMAFVLAIAASGLSIAGAWPALVEARNMGSTLSNPPADGAAPGPVNLPPARDATSLAQAAPAGGTNHMMAAVLQQGEDPFEALRKIAAQMQHKQVAA